MKVKFTDLVNFTGRACRPFGGQKYYISTGCVHDDHIADNEVEIIDYENKPSRANLEVMDGDIIFAKMQGTKKTLVINDELANHIYSTGFCAICPKNNTITHDCLYYLISSKLFLDAKDKNCSGATQKAITKAGLSRIELSIPSIKDQEKISVALKKLDAIIWLRNRQLQQLDTLVKARFVEMFGLSGVNPKGWNVTKLGVVCDLQNGYAFKSSDYIDKSSVLNCRMSNIRPDGEFDPDYHPKYLPEEYWDKYASYQLSDGDVIIAMTDMASDPKILGVPTIISTRGRKFLLNQRVGKLKFLHDDRINRVYLIYSLGQKYVRKELAKSAAGSTQINVGKPAILDIDIYEPPKSLQDHFSSFVSQVDKSKFASMPGSDYSDETKLIVPGSTDYG